MQVVPAHLGLLEVHGSRAEQRGAPPVQEHGAVVRHPRALRADHLVAPTQHLRRREELQHRRDDLWVALLV